MIDHEFYETPWPLTSWLFTAMARHKPIQGRVCEPCVGSGAIVKAVWPDGHWFTNDIDPRWPADCHKDATDPTYWAAHEFDWVITNPPFSKAIEIATLALANVRVGVAMHLRASIHEVLKTGVRRTWMAENRPAGTLWLPRVAYQRSRTTGKWTTDSVTGCWVIWLKDREAHQFIEYAPESVLDALETDTPAFRQRADELCGYAGSEIERQRQHVERWKDVAA